MLPFIPGKRANELRDAFTVFFVALFSFFFIELLLGRSERTGPAPATVVVLLPLDGSVAALKEAFSTFLKRLVSFVVALVLSATPSPALSVTLVSPLDLFTAVAPELTSKPLCRGLEFPGSMVPLTKFGSALIRVRPAFEWLVPFFIRN